jgi:ribosomal protein S18 acetylase RimI-like enzyme
VRTTAPGLGIQFHDADGMHQLRVELLDVYSEAYAARLDQPFSAPPRFWERLEAYAGRSGFSLVTGRLSGELVAYTLGFTLPAGSGWWRGLRGEVDPKLIEEDGSRTFALTEMMVRPAYQRRGYARALHDALLADRPEQRATLLVRPDNVAARSAYLSWGWYKVGDLQPFDDAPVFEAMVRKLYAPYLLPRRTT